MKIADEAQKQETSEPENKADSYEVPIDQYLQAGIHIGTKFKTKYMENFIYKIRNDGLYVLDMQQIDERIKIASQFLAQYEPHEILIASRRENSWRPVKLFGKITGVQVFAGRYPPGVLTNAELKNFMNVKVVVVTDVWPDRNVVNDAIKVGTPVVALCDTNNKTNNVDLVVPCNNKGKKSLALFFYVLARNYLRQRGELRDDQEVEGYTYEDFIQD